MLAVMCTAQQKPALFEGGGGGVDWPVSGKRMSCSECRVTSEENRSTALNKQRVEHD